MDTSIRSGLVTAIITTYKRENDMLRQAVESILAQTYPLVELVVVSDNPPESQAAKDVAALMADYPSALFIQLAKNSGAQVARNTGIRASHGEFVAFLDDDDLWLPEKLAKQMPFFDDPKVGLAYCQGYTFSDETPDKREPYDNVKRGFHPVAKFEELLVRDYIGSTSQAVIRRKCFDNCGYFDENLRARQDYDRWLAITSGGWRALGVAEPLFLHRMHRGEQITKNPQVALDSNAYVFHKYGAAFRKSRTACMAYYYNRAFVLRGMGKPLAFALNAARSFLYQPKAFVAKYRSYREDDPCA